MDLKNRIRNYLEEEFHLEVYKDSLSVLNYEEIGHFDSEKIILDYKEGRIVVKGKNLVVKKLMKEEILVTGLIQGIEFRYEK